MNEERWIYQKRKDDDDNVTLREYLQGDYYTEIYGDGDDDIIVGTYVKCKETTMKAWGKRITVEEAKKINPKLDELKAQSEKILEEQLEEEQQEHIKLSLLVRDMTKREVLSTVATEELEIELKRRKERPIAL